MQKVEKEINQGKAEGKSIFCFFLWIAFQEEIL